MVKEVDLSQLRRHLGIKRLKKRIPVSEYEKAAIRNLREEEKRRVTRAEKLKA
ncbi:MAG: hypothetical protein ACYC7D_03580 [Nitrososphaerales archaeon]